MSRTYRDEDLYQILNAMEERIFKLESAVPIPIGAVIIWPGSLAELPLNLLLCNGQAVSRTTYALLYSRIGSRNGDGDGTTTFNVPNYSNIFLKGGDEQGNIGDSGGLERVALTENEMPVHVHPPSAGFERFWFSDPAAAPVVQTGGSYTANNAPFATGPAGGGASHENQPPYITTNFVIAAL